VVAVADAVGMLGVVDVVDVVVGVGVVGAAVGPAVVGPAVSGAGGDDAVAGTLAVTGDAAVTPPPVMPQPASELANAVAAASTKST
jgi:hypothetical protein